MVDYEFLDFNLKDEIKNIKKYFSSSISEIEGKYEQLLNQSEEKYYGEKVEKVNKFGIGQKRYLILTNKALYNFKLGLLSISVTLKRRIPYINLRGITFEKYGDKIVIHGENSEYDYYYKIPSLEKVIGYLATFYELETSKPLKIIPVEKSQSLKNFVTTKDAKKNNQNFSKMDEDKAIINCLPRLFNKISMNPKKLLYREDKYKKYGHSRYDQIVSQYKHSIISNPSLLETVCIICLKDKNYKEIPYIDKITYKDRQIIKGKFFNELVQYINQESFTRLKPFLIQNNKCPHFYHKYCLNFSKYISYELNCALCKYGITSRNLYLFEYPGPDIYHRIHLYLNNANDLDGIIDSYNEIFRVFKNNYIQYISSGEKRKTVEDSIEIRLKCITNKNFRKEYFYLENIHYPLDFEIDFDDKEIQVYKKRYENWEKSLLKKNSYDEGEDADDEDYYRNKSNHVNISNKKEYLYVCHKCDKFCLFCGRKKTGSMWYNTAIIKGHLQCTTKIKSCIVCGTDFGLRNANNYCEDCRRKKSAFISFYCYICKKK